MILSTATLILCVGLPPAAGGGAESPAPEDAAAPEPWRAALERMREQSGAMARDLEAARSALVERARGDPEATALLTPEPVRARTPGYGVVPDVIEDNPRSSVQPTEKLYSLERLPLEFAPALDAAAALAAAAADPLRPLRPLIDELGVLEQRLRNLEDHLGYHAYWQRAVEDYPAFFDHLNGVVAEVREMEARRRRGEDAAVVEALGSRILDEFAGFRRTPGLVLERRPDGTRVLPVTVTTDIRNERFLDAFREGVEAAFVHSEAARAERFRLELTLGRLRPSELYPAGPPRRGERIDPAAHLARFPAGALVLTTGEESTNAWPGRSIVLGPADITRRTLAHEFAHLLGFRDAYLRGFDPASDGRFGVVLVEWTGLRDDLMGNAKGGEVTPQMIRTLIRAYDPR